MPRLVCTCQLRAQTWGFLETSSQLRCRGPCSEWSLVLHTPASHRRSTSSSQTRSSWQSQSRPEGKKRIRSVSQTKLNKKLNLFHINLYQIIFVLMCNDAEARNRVIISIFQFFTGCFGIEERVEQLVAALPKATNWFLHEERNEWQYPKKHRTRLNLNYTFLRTIIILLFTANMRQVCIFHWSFIVAS